MNPQEVTITLPIETINLCLSGLVKLPYEVAHQHIALIQQRGAAALAEANKPEPMSEGGTAD